MTRDHQSRDTLRVPPHAVEAEQAVLGGLLIVSRAWWDVCDMLAEGDFYRRDHQLIWRAIAEMHRQQKPCDAITLGEWFEAQGLAEQVGGVSYVIELCNTTPSAANIRAYAQIVADKSRLRRVIDASVDLTNAAFDARGRTAVELIGEAQTRIGALLNSEPCELEAVAPVMQRVWSRLQTRHEADSKIHGISTGLMDLDQVLGGLAPGQLGIIAARPKMGKTTLAQNITEHVALRLQKPAAVFSFEMQPDELGDRMLASIGNVKAGNVRSGQLDQDEWSRAMDAITRLQSAPIYISRPKRARVEHVIAQMRRQHARTPLGLCVIDYLQLMDAPGDNRATAIADISRALKLAAGELQIPILLLSQLNRDLEKRPDKRPIPSDLRDSGAIEQDADFVLFIYRDEIYNTDSRYRGTAELIVALQRSGPTGDVRVLYQPDRFLFSDLPAYWQPESPPPKPLGTQPRRGLRRARSGDGDAT